MSSLRHERELPRPGERRRAALLLSLFALVCLWGPLTSGGMPVRAPAPGAYPLLEGPGTPAPAHPGSAATNEAADHVWRLDVPWLTFSREKLLHGQLPTWNGLSGAGVPHLANPEAAVFSPFSWPVYGLGLHAGLLLGAFARLFLLAFFTFLFARERHLSFWSALTAAVVFAFAGHATVNLLRPSSGAAVLLPAGLWLVERAIATAARHVDLRRRSGMRDAHDEAERSGAARGLVRLACGLSLALGLGWLCGSVATFALSVVAIGAWSCVRVGTHVGAHGVAHAAATFARTGLVIACAVVAGAAIAGVVALPWLEFVRAAAVPVDLAPGARDALPVRDWPLACYPNLFGSPAGGWALVADAVAPGWTVIAACHVGGPALFLAACGLVVACRTATAWFATALVGVFVAGLHGLVGGRDLIALAPAWIEHPVQELAVFGAFGTALLAAHAVDHLSRRDRPARVTAGVTAAAGGLALLAAAHAAAGRLWMQVMEASPAHVDRSSGYLTARAETATVAAWMLAATGFVLLGWSTRSITWRRRAAFALVLVAFGSSGVRFAREIPATSFEAAYPHGERAREFARATSGRDVAWIGAVGWPGATNLVHPIRSQTVPGPWRIRRHDQLRAALFAPRGPDGFVAATTERALQIFGLEVVAATDRWVEVDTEFAGHASGPFSTFVTDEILPGAPLVQRIVPLRDAPRALRFAFVTGGTRNTCAFEVTVRDAESGAVLATLSIPRGEARPRGERLLEVAVPLPDEARAAGRALELRVESPDAVAGRGWRLRGRRDAALVLAGLAREAGTDTIVPADEDLRAWQGTTRLAGALDYDLAYAPAAFVLEREIGPVRVLGHTNWAPRCRTVGSARVAPDGTRALALLVGARGDATVPVDTRQVVVLEGADPALERDGPIEHEGDTHLEALEDRDGVLRVIVDRPTPGFVVAPIAWYPGWNVAVNRSAATPLCANYAFTAVAVPAGESLVEFAYAPRSVTRGAWLTCAGVLAVVIAWLASRAKPAPSSAKNMAGSTA